MPDPVVTAAPNALAWRLGRNCRLRPAHLLLGVCAAPAAACVPAAVLLALGYPFVGLFALVDALFDHDKIDRSKVKAIVLGSVVPPLTTTTR